MRITYCDIMRDMNEESTAEDIMMAIKGTYLAHADAGFKGVINLSV